MKRSKTSKVNLIYSNILMLIKLLEDKHLALADLSYFQFFSLSTFNNYLNMP